MCARIAGRGQLAHAIFGLLVLLTVSAVSLAATACTSPSKPHEPEPPKTVVMNGAQLAAAKARYAAGDPELVGAVGNLTVQADQWLRQGPWTVVDKDQTPPSGDKHDYFSQAPYFWPTAPKTAANPYGCPYVEKDGQRNPDVDKMTDRPEVGKVFEAVYELTLAWYYTAQPAYAQHATDILRAWFVTPATRMNPNLNHAQFIPCQKDGRSIGIIDFSQGFTSLLDATAILDTGAPGWTATDRDGFTAWNKQFLDWLRQGTFGREEAAQKNNHGTFFDMQAAAIALKIGDTTTARNLILDARTTRIDAQLSSDGGQPAELARTRGWHYSTFNLVALTRLAAIGDHLGVDLWHYTGPKGANILKAVDFLIPAATRTTPWVYPDLDPHWYAANDIVQAAADHGDAAARAAVPRLETPPGGNLYPVRPAAEQLDSIATTG